MKNNKKTRVPNIVLYLIGLNLICIGIILILNANFGISAATSVPTALYNAFDQYSFGFWNYAGQSLAIIAVAIILKKIKVSYILAFLSGIVYAIMLDLWSFILSPLSTNLIGVRIFILVIGNLILSFGVIMSMISRYPVLPFEMFVRELSDNYNISIGKVKVIFDVSMVLISMSLSFYYFRDFRSVGLGTIFIAFTGGFLMDYFQNNILNNIEGYFLIDEAKFNNIVEKKILG